MGHGPALEITGPLRDQPRALGQLASRPGVRHGQRLDPILELPGEPWRGEGGVVGQECKQLGPRPDPYRVPPDLGSRVGGGSDPVPRHGSPSSTVTWAIRTARWTDRERRSRP